MRHFRLTEHDRVTLFGQPYRMVDKGPEGYRLRALSNDQVFETLTHQQLTDLVDTPEFRVDQGFFTAEQQGLIARHGKRDIFATAPQTMRAKTLWRLACVEAFLRAAAQDRLPRTESAIKAVQPVLEREAQTGFGLALQSQALRAGDLIGSRKFPCPRTLLSWVRAYQAGGGHIDALTPETHKSGRYGPRFSQEELRLMSGVIDHYADTSRPTQKQAIVV